MTTPDRYEPYRAVMRAQHGYCGPYRLGIAIGEAGVRLPNPYERARARAQFDAGVLNGRERQAEKLARTAVSGDVS